MTEITSYEEFAGVGRSDMAVWFLDSLPGLKAAYDKSITVGIWDWLVSPDGINAIKQAMIERGYDVTIGYSHDSKIWDCLFYPWKKSKEDAVYKPLQLTYFEYQAEKETESEAVIHAAAKALLEGE